jgi:hypothetical protein
MVDDKKEFTVMFYFASDNPLAISVVSQLKAIKAAGFHKDANVIVQFDPFTEGTPTHIFDVNMIEKLKSSCECGKKDDKHLVLNLIDDKLWNGERTRKGKFVRAAISELVKGYDPHHPPNGTETINGETQELGPQRSLDKFLEFCSYAYPAKHYLLFILGHGVVVGNDVFLFDENAEERSLKLGSLRRVLKKFSDDVKLDGGRLDLLGFHSCSVASAEVAYELRDTARYMLASQGTAFVGNWPYKQLLRRIFDSLEKETVFSEQTLRKMLVQMFSFCMQNSTDFLLAGYPFDLTLYDLSKISTLQQPLAKLSKALVEGLKDFRCADLIILAHWRSQSFYQEMYTDLYDFCYCLQQLLQRYRLRAKAAKGLLAACNAVIKTLKKERNGERKAAKQKFIICSESAGPEYQYAHGMSVYFPWSRPSSERRIVEEYAEYQISGEEFETTWLDFLNEYWTTTMRKPSQEEQGLPEPSPLHALYEDKISLVYTHEGPRDGQNALDQYYGKVDPKDPLGGDAGFSIKNFPKDIRGRREPQQAGEAFALSNTFFSASAP